MPEIGLESVVKHEDQFETGSYCLINDEKVLIARSDSFIVH